MKFNLFKTKKEIEPKRLKLMKELTYDHGYSILRSSTTLKEDNEFILDLAKQYDEYGYMSEELGRELDKLFEDENYIIGIHRTGYNYMDDEMVNTIFNEGLINNGHIMQGGIAGNLDIEKTATLFDNFTIMNGQLKVAHSYKSSQGCVIIKIPKSYLGRAGGDIQPIYYRSDNVTKLLPEFVYGYVPVDKDGKLGEMQKNPNYKDIHNLNNVNLMYEGKIYYRAKREGYEIQHDDISLNEKYKIIEKAYQDTLLKYGKYRAEQALLNLINKNDVKYFAGQENIILLRKYIIYGDILNVLSLSGNNLLNENEIINSFIESSNVILEQNNKSK